MVLPHLLVHSRKNDLGSPTIERFKNTSGCVECNNFFVPLSLRKKVQERSVWLNNERCHEQINNANFYMYDENSHFHFNIMSLQCVSFLFVLFATIFHPKVENWAKIDNFSRSMKLFCKNVPRKFIGVIYLGVVGLIKLSETCRGVFN